jgi:hypothetical protein
VADFAFPPATCADYSSTDSIHDLSIVPPWGRCDLQEPFMPRRFPTVMPVSGFWVLCVAMLLAPLGFADDTKTETRPASARRPNPAMAKVMDVPGLPRVLLIGDSISIGYTVPVREMLQGKANVHRPLTNCGPTSRGVAEIEDWLGKEKWDVIHFNFGLHDLKYLGPNGRNLADPQVPGSHQQVPPEQYEANLRSLVAALQKTGAKLIWRSTTPVPQGAAGRVPGDAVKYNAIAARIMDEHQIPIDDQYAFAMTCLEKIQRPANVHFTEEGSRALAAQAAAAIEKALAR